MFWVEFEHLDPSFMQYSDKAEEKSSAVWQFALYYYALISFADHLKQCNIGLFLI